MSGVAWTRGAPWPPIGAVESDAWEHGAPGSAIGSPSPAIYHSGVASAAGVSTAAAGGATSGVATASGSAPATSTALAVGRGIPPLPTIYQEIVSFPYTFTIPAVDLNAVRLDDDEYQALWFHHTVVTPSQMLGVQVMGATGVDADTTVTVYFADPDLLEQKQSDIEQAISTPLLEAGTEVWIKVRLADAEGTAIFDPLVATESATIIADVAGIDLPVPDGSLIINDDTPPNYGVALAPDGTFITFLTLTPASEYGAGLETGETLWEDHVTRTFTLLDSDHAFVANIDIGEYDAPRIFTNRTDKFYIWSRIDVPSGYESRITVVYRDGTYDLDRYLLPDGTDSFLVSAMAVSRDGAVLYYWTPHTVNTPGDLLTIKRYDLVNDVALSDLFSVSSPTSTIFSAAITPNGHFGDMLALADGSIVTWYGDYTGNTDYLVHLTAFGTVINTFVFDRSVAEIDHLAYAADDPDGIWVWTYTASDEARATGRIAHITLATGADVPGEAFDTALFGNYYNIGTRDTQLFGPSNSCTFIPPKTLEFSPPPEPPEPPPRETIPDCCDTNTGPGDTGVNPDPINPLPPWEDPCEPGGDVDMVADLVGGEVW